MATRVGAAWRSEAILFLLLLVVYAWPRDLDRGPNANAHLGQAIALGVDGTLAIDAYAKRSDTYTIDWARAPDGRLYPAKAPGCGLALAPLMWALARTEEAFGIDPRSEPAIWRKGVLATLVLNALPSALCMVLLFRLTIALRFSRPASYVGTLGVALGTAYHPYATALYAHVPTANLLVVAAAATFMNEGRRWVDALGGMSAGFAVVFDYPAVLGVASCAAALVALRGSAVFWFAAGGVLPLAILLGYHTAVFGSPLATPYAFQNPVFTPVAGSLFAAPNAQVLAALLVSPYRGVLFYSPALIAALAGAMLLWCGDLCGSDAALKQKQRVYVAFSVATASAWLVLNSSYFTWNGGYTTGPRFVIPALVLLAPLVSAGWQRYRVITTALLGVSIVNQFAIATVWLQVPDSYTNPLAQVIYPGLLSGEFMRGNLGMRLGLSGLWSLAPLSIFVVAASGAIWADIQGRHRQRVLVSLRDRD